MDSADRLQHGTIFPPYEFFAYWTPVEVRAPKLSGEEGFSVWTQEGELYMELPRRGSDRATEATHSLYRR